MESSTENSPSKKAKPKQQARNRYPFVTSIRESSSWQTTGRKASPTVHLLSYMAEFLDEDSQQPPAKALQLNQFEKLKQHNHTHHFDLDFRKNSSNHSRQPSKQPAKELISQLNETFQSSKQLKCRMANHVDSFNRTASTTKHSNFLEGPRGCQREKTTIAQQIKHRMKESLANYVRSSDRRDLQTKLVDMSEQYEKRLSELVGELAKVRRQNTEMKEEQERKLLEMSVEVAKQRADQDNVRQQYEQTLKELQKTRASTNDLKEFRKEYKQLVESYPDMTCSKLLKEYKRLQHVCLTRLGDLDKELVDRFELEKRPLEARVEKLVSENKQLQQQIIELTRRVNGRHLVETLDAYEVEDLKKSKEELTSLQNKILDIYVRWESHKSESEKEVLSHYGCLAQQYSYIQMLEYMEFDKKELCTDQKTRQFLRRTLGLIQMTRKKLFNEPVPDKKNPQKILEQIVRLVMSMRKQLKHNEPKSGKLEE